MCAASCVTEQDESLIALTTHLTQIQFRLSQVITAPGDSKGIMLRELEEFVKNGCHGNHGPGMENPDENQAEKDIVTISNRQDIQYGDVSELKVSSSLEDDALLPGDQDDHVESSVIATEPCHPQAIGHHGDYIDYVKQAEEASHDPASLPVVQVQPIRIEGFGSSDLNTQHNEDDKPYFTSHLITLLSLLQCGCGISSWYYRHSNHIQSSDTSKQLHSLSTAIDRISMLVSMAELDHMTSVKMATIEIELHTAVTMEMADSLIRLLSDGLLIKKHSSPWQHKVWSLLQAYYNDKHQIVHPTQSLATSFDLPLSDKNSPRKTLIHVIQLMEKYYEQFPNGPLHDELKFRGLICKGFNLKHLSSWIQLLSNHTSVLKSSYSSQSFALQTGFQPIVVQLRRLDELPNVPEVLLPSEQSILSHQFCIT